MTYYGHRQNKFDLIDNKSFILRAVSALSILCLYFIIAEIGSYRITVGGVICGLIILFSAKKCNFQILPIIIATIFFAWPLFIMGVSQSFGAQLTPKISQFIASYCLWAVSVVILLVSAISRKPVALKDSFLINCVVVAFASAQAFGVRLFGNYAAYDLIMPLVGVDPEHNYLNLTDLLSARAIGLYYEPSMCGRIIGTLCFIDIIINKKLFRNAIILALGIVTTKSLGLIILSIVLGGVIFVKNSKHILALMILAGAVVSVYQLGAFEGGKGAYKSREGSNYRRVVAPVKILEWQMLNYPLGIPIGSAAKLAVKTGYYQETKESKVTNGIYEFIFYFGFLGIIVILFSATSSVIYVLSKNRELSCAVIYVVLSTGLSGSFLSIESTLITFYFVVACRVASQRQQRAPKTFVLASTATGANS